MNGNQKISRKIKEKEKRNDLFEGNGPSNIAQAMGVFLDDQPYSIYSLFIGANQA